MKKNTIVSIEQDVVKDIKANRKKRIKGSLFVNKEDFDELLIEQKGRVIWIHFAVKSTGNRRLTHTGMV